MSSRRGKKISESQEAGANSSTMNTSIRRGRASRVEAQPSTPSRRSARLRGAEVEFTPDRLEQLEKRTRQSRSRSNTPSVRATPRKGENTEEGEKEDEGRDNTCKPRRISFGEDEMHEEGDAAGDVTLMAQPEAEDPTPKSAGKTRRSLTKASPGEVKINSPSKQQGTQYESNNESTATPRATRGRRSSEAAKEKTVTTVAKKSPLPSKMPTPPAIAVEQETSSDEDSEDNVEAPPVDNEEQPAAPAEEKPRKSRKRRLDSDDEEEKEEEDVEDAATVQNNRKRFKQSAVDDEFFNLDEMHQFCDEEERREEKARKLGNFQGAEELSELIQQYEEENLQPRSWELSGEVTANERKKDELLEEYIEVDYRSSGQRGLVNDKIWVCLEQGNSAQKTAPDITEEHTSRLESIISQRIRDKAFDDVVRKFRQDETALVASYRNKTRIEVEQSVRKSLAEVYEDKFQEAQTKEETVGGSGETEVETYIDPATEAIDSDMKVLFQKLDALSHFQFKPTEIKPELKIVSNLRSMRVEEVGPLASTSADSQMLAPSEVFTVKKGPLKAKEERTDTDKKRERRKKKIKQRTMAAQGLMPKPKDKADKQGDPKSKKGREGKVKKRKNPNRDETMSSEFEFNVSGASQS